MVAKMRKRAGAFQADGRASGRKLSAGDTGARQVKEAVLITNAKAGPAIIDSIDAKWSGALPATFVYDKAGTKTKSKTGAITAKTIGEWLKE